MIINERGKNELELLEIYKGMSDTCILSCIEGHMGEVFVDDLDNVKSALCILGDFIFVAGEKNLKVVSFLEKQSGIVVFEDEEYEEFFISSYSKEYRVVERIAFRKDISDLLDTDFSEFIDKIKEGYAIKRIDRKIYKECKENAFTYDFVSNFYDEDDFIDNGVGFVIVKDDIIVSGASSYSYFDEGIEIEIATSKEYRKRGLAKIVGAKLIDYCIKNNLYPSWDAANEISMNIALEFGYKIEKRYNAYEI